MSRAVVEPETVRIGTRGSPLALAQARIVAQALNRPCEIVVVKTTGDHILDRPLAEVGGKGLFTKEIEDKLLDGSIDIAVHSMKDMPTELPKGLVMGAMLERADPRDALLARGATCIAELRRGAHVGTASLRRAAQLSAKRPDLRISTLRGSVQTRIRRVEEGAFDATLLAEAGLERLGLDSSLREPLSIEEMLPAVAQGAIGIECHDERAEVRSMLAAIDHPATSLCVEAERAFLRALDGSCRTPIAGHARLIDGRVEFRGLLAKPDGTAVHRRQASAAADMAVEMGRKLGEELLSLVGPGFVAG